MNEERSANKGVASKNSVDSEKESEENRTPMKNLAISFGLALIILIVVYLGMKFF